MQNSIQYIVHYFCCKLSNNGTVAYDALKRCLEMIRFHEETALGNNRLAIAY